MNDLSTEDASHLTLDPKLAQKALKRLQNIVRGNGIKPSSITLGETSGQVLEFRAYGHFTVESRVSEKMMPGKENGEPATSQQDARTKIQSYMDSISTDPDVKTMTMTLLKKRKDIGFGLEGSELPLKHLNKIYVAHEGCTSCSTSGKVPCPKCHGQGKTQCVQCHGQKDMTCPICRGMQFQNTAQGQIPCSRCQGQGRMACDMCQRTGMMSCNHCRTTGKIACQNCHGSGWNSHMTHLEVLAKSRFGYDQENLPDKSITLINKYGPRLVTEDHATIRFIEDQGVWKELDQRSAHGEYLIPYDVKIPFGQCDFQIGKASLTATLFGLQADLPDLPPFMEKVTMRGLRALNEAAQTPVSATGRLQEAARYRIIAEAFMGASTMSPKKLAAKLKSSYPFGFTDKTLFKIASLSYKALQHVTKRPRAMGLAIGLALSALLYMMSFVLPLRQDMAFNTQALLDLFLPITGGIITTIAIQITISRTLRRLFDTISPSHNTKKLMPNAAQNIIWGVGGAFIVYGLFLTLTIFTNMPTSIWLEKILL